MSENLDLVKSYLLDLDLSIVHEDEAEELLIVSDEESGINKLIIDCEPPIVILEQLIMPVPDEGRKEFFERLLQMNHTLVHGAFALDDESKHVYFRDTLQLENLDANELEASVQALSLAMAEHSAELLKFSRRQAPAEANA